MAHEQVPTRIIKDQIPKTPAPQIHEGVSAYYTSSYDFWSSQDKNQGIYRDLKGRQSNLCFGFRAYSSEGFIIEANINP